MELIVYFHDGLAFRRELFYEEKRRMTCNLSHADRQILTCKLIQLQKLQKYTEKGKDFCRKDMTLLPVKDRNIISDIKSQ